MGFHKKTYLCLISSSPFHRPFNFHLAVCKAKCKTIMALTKPSPKPFSSLVSAQWLPIPRMLQLQFSREMKVQCMTLMSSLESWIALASSWHNLRSKCRGRGGGGVFWANMQHGNLKAGLDMETARRVRSKVPDVLLHIKCSLNCAECARYV